MEAAKTRKVALIKLRAYYSYEDDYSKNILVDQSDWEEVTEDEYNSLVAASSNGILNPWGQDFTWILLEKPSDMLEKIKCTVRDQIKYIESKKKELEDTERKRKERRDKAAATKRDKELKKLAELKEKYEQ